jgi:flagellar assembly protein FliH
MSSRVLSTEELETHEIVEFPYPNAGSSSASGGGSSASALDHQVSHGDMSVDSDRALFEQGYREGEKAALAAAEQRLAPARKRLEESVAKLGSLRSELYRQAEQDLVKLSLSIASKIVRREVRIDPDIVRTLVRISLEKLSHATTAHVRLNPDDYRALAAAQAEGRDPNFGPGVVLVEDVNVESGGAVIETDAGTADARIDMQLQEIADELLATF